MPQRGQAGRGRGLRAELGAPRAGATRGLPASARSAGPFRSVLSPFPAFCASLLPPGKLPLAGGRLRTAEPGGSPLREQRPGLPRALRGARGTPRGPGAHCGAGDAARAEPGRAEASRAGPSRSRCQPRGERSAAAPGPGSGAAGDRRPAAGPRPAGAALRGPGGPSRRGRSVPPVPPPVRAAFRRVRPGRPCPPGARSAEAPPSRAERAAPSERRGALGRVPADTGPARAGAERPQREGGWWERSGNGRAAKRRGKDAARLIS